MKIRTDFVTNSSSSSFVSLYVSDLPIVQKMEAGYGFMTWESEWGRLKSVKSVGELITCIHEIFGDNAKNLEQIQEVTPNLEDIELKFISYGQSWDAEIDEDYPEFEELSEGDAVTKETKISLNYKDKTIQKSEEYDSFPMSESMW